MIFGFLNALVPELRAMLDTWSRAVRGSSLILLGFALAFPAAAAVIEGRVTDAETGVPLAGVPVEITAAVGVQTDTEGYYRIENLAADFYYLYVGNPPDGYVGQIYGGSWCLSPSSYLGCAVDLGAAVTVSADEVRSGIDIELDPTVPIRGTIRGSSSGQPIQASVFGYVCFDDLFGCIGAVSATAAADGQYQLDAPPANGLYVQAGADDYLSEVFDDVLCAELAQCDLSAATLLDTSPKQPIEGIDFDLVGEARIRGTAMGAGNPINGLIVWLFDETGEFITLDFTDTDGEYEFSNLPGGTYLLQTVSAYWADELYGGLYCPQADGICDVTRGTPVDIVAGATTDGIDFALEVGGTITGRVTAELSGEPLLFGSVSAYSLDGQRISLTTLDAEGHFSLSGLAPGEYVVGVAEASGYLPQLYAGVNCGEFPYSSCDVSLGDKVAVDLGETVDGIDFVLQRFGQCEPSETRLCLNKGRFAIDLTFQTENTYGDARAEPLDFADDSGYFWFFKPGNVEVTVKVLDACHTQSNKFWVFAAGLTNLQTDLTITDTFTGDVQTYSKPAGRPFEPILDTRAFDTCLARSGPRPAEVADEATSEPANNGAEVERSWLSVPLLQSRSGGCVPGPGVLCLREGRFQVVAMWEEPDGDFGQASAENLTDEAGFFWFFEQGNIEITIKVLSNCGGNTDRFWVFTAGLTNLGVHLEVTDTETGEVRFYDNPVDQPFEPILDTRAFATCP